MAGCDFGPGSAMYFESQCIPIRNVSRDMAQFRQLRGLPKIPQSGDSMVAKCFVFGQLQFRDKNVPGENCVRSGSDRTPFRMKVSQELRNESFPYWRNRFCRPSRGESP